MGSLARLLEHETNTFMVGITDSFFPHFFSFDVNSSLMQLSHKALNSCHFKSKSTPVFAAFGVAIIILPFIHHFP